MRRGANLLAGAFAVYWVIERLWPSPFGVLVKGAVIGGLYAMIALGIALVYRANRIINFAQGDLGGAPASLCVLLIVASGWPYPLAIAVGLVSGVALGMLVEFVLIRRFAKAPRLILTVVTIGIAQLLTVVEIEVPNWFHVGVPPQTFPSPFNFSFAIGPQRFQGNDVLAMIMIPVVLAGLAWFLNRTHMGIAVRACAESSDRASLLGVPVKRINLVVWGVASLMATIAVILRAGVVGLPIGSALGLSVLLRTLAAAAIGRFERMTTIVVAALFLGMVEAAVIWHTGSSDAVNLVVFLVILAALLLQRTRLASRAEEAALSTWTAMREVRPVPPELSRLPEVLWAKRALLTGLVAFALFVPGIFGPAKLELAIYLCGYLIVALSLLVLSGWAGQISLGQFAFVGVGAATGAYMIHHWRMDLLLVLVISGTIGAVVAVLVGIPALRIKGLFLAVATLGFSFACNSYFLSSNHFSWIPSQFDQIPRLPVFGRIDIAPDNRFYYFCALMVGASILGVRALRRSRTGRVLIAVRENERGVQAYGVSVIRAKLTAFAVSGFLASVAGVLIMLGQNYLYQGQADPQSSVDAFVMVVVGGLGSMTGVFSGAVFLESLSWFKGSVPKALGGAFAALGSGVGLIVVLMFLPGGVGSLLFLARDRLLRRLAARRGIIVPSLVADAAGPRGIQETTAASKAEDYLEETEPLQEPLAALGEPMAALRAGVAEPVGAGERG